MCQKRFSMSTITDTLWAWDRDFILCQRLRGAWASLFISLKSSIFPLFPRTMTSPSFSSTDKGAFHTLEMSPFEDLSKTKIIIYRTRESYMCRKPDSLVTFSQNIYSILICCSQRRDNTNMNLFRSYRPFWPLKRC